MASLAHCQLWHLLPAASPLPSAFPLHPCLRYLSRPSRCVCHSHRKRHSAAQQSLYHRTSAPPHSRNGTRRCSLPRATLPPRCALRRRPEGRGTGHRTHRHAGGSRQEDARPRRHSDHHTRRRHRSGRSAAHHPGNACPRRRASHHHPGTRQGPRRGPTQEGRLAPCPGAQGPPSARRGARGLASRRTGTRHHSHQTRRPGARAGQEEEEVLQEEEEQGSGTRSRRRGPRQVQVQEGKVSRVLRRRRCPIPRPRRRRRRCRHRGRNPNNGRKHHVGVRIGARPRRPPGLDGTPPGEPVRPRRDVPRRTIMRPVLPFGRVVPPHFALYFSSIFPTAWAAGRPALPCVGLPLTFASDSFSLLLYQTEI